MKPMDMLQSRTDSVRFLYGVTPEQASSLEGAWPLLQFDYTNWRGVPHTYVVDPECIALGPYDVGGLDPSQVRRWVLHASVVTRDGDPRPEMHTNRRRTFMLFGLRNVKWVDRSV